MSRNGAVAVRLVDVDGPVESLNDLADYERVRIYAHRGDRLLGFAEVRNAGAPLSARRVREALVDALGVRLILKEGSELLNEAALHSLIESVAPQLVSKDEDLTGGSEKLDATISASIVVATLDRPEDLRSCIGWLREQVTPRRVEIIVVDNRPSSGIAQSVMAEFPEVVLVEESRQGLAYARNAGILAASGDVIVMTDDDVRPPKDWLEKLIAPLARNDVGAATGNVLPLELETPAQRLFEIYGGLGRGFERREIDMRWFRSAKWVVPTWTLGASANAAFKASLFREPEVGLMCEALGPGMPSGVGEDTYLFYKILKAGYTIIYEPSAYVWHRHRTEMSALRKQLYDYSKGHVAYNLMTLINDGDFRALGYLALRLPYGHLRRIVKEVRGRTPYPVKLSLVEMRGNVAGPMALLKSWRRVAREGRSDTERSTDRR